MLGQEDDDVVLLVDYNKICRLCLHSTGVMSDIFETNEHEQTSIKDLILLTTSLEVSKDDGLPSKICHKCRYIVELCQDMCTMVMKNNILLTKATSEENLAIQSGDEFNDVKINKIIIKKEISLNCENDAEYLDLEYTCEDEDVNGSDIDFKTNNDTGSDNDEFEDENEQNYKRERTKNSNEDKVVQDTKNDGTRKPKGLSCQLCLVHFNTHEEVKQHVAKHYVNTELTSYLQLQKPYKCEVCADDVTINKFQLRKHHREHLNINPLECQYPGCNFVGRDLVSASSHQRIHYARVHVCEVCGAKYRRACELRAHAYRHSGDTLACHECDRHFLHPDALRAHLVTHRPPKFKCGWRGCPKAYFTKYEMEGHRRVHTQDKPYKCHLCDVASYHKKVLLDRHLNRHDTAHNNRCDKCGARFKDYGEYYKHRVQAHGHWNPSRCVGCSRRYPNDEKLEEHMKDCAVARQIRAYESQHHEQGDQTDLEHVLPHAQETMEVEVEDRQSTLIEQTEEFIQFKNNIHPAITFKKVKK